MFYNSTFTGKIGSFCLAGHLYYQKANSSLDLLILLKYISKVRKYFALVFAVANQRMIKFSMESLSPCKNNMQCVKAVILTYLIFPFSQ